MCICTSVRDVHRVCTVLACDQALLQGEGEREKGRAWGTSAISDIIGQALSQLFTLLSECYDNNAIRAGMNMFMSARAYA